MSVFLSDVFSEVSSANMSQLTLLLAICRGRSVIKIKNRRKREKKRQTETERDRDTERDRLRERTMLQGAICHYTHSGFK